MVTTVFDGSLSGEEHMCRIGYRKLKRYKYRLMENYTMPVDMKPDNDIVVTDFVILTTAGELTVNKHYAWDGPSGPTIDTKSFLRGSLVHDVLYQLMREQRLSQSHRKYADELLREMCREDGMSRFRAWYVYHALRLFASGAAKPSLKPPDGMLHAP